MHNDDNKSQNKCIQQTANDNAYKGCLERMFVQLCVYVCVYIINYSILRRKTVASPKYCQNKQPYSIACTPSNIHKSTGMRVINTMNLFKQPKCAPELKLSKLKEP